MVKGTVLFLSFKKGGGVVFALSLLLQPIQVFKVIKLIIIAIQEIFQALPLAFKELFELSAKERVTLLELIILGLQEVESQ